MKKIFSAALALVCIWFATPALAALPSGYTQLEYIESTGTQYIDTGIKANLNTKAILDFQLSNYNNRGAILGSRVDQNTNAFIIGSNSGEFVNTTYPFAQFDNVTPTSVKSLPNFDLNRHIFELSSDGFYIDRTLYLTYSNPTSFSTQENIVLFARYSSGRLVYGAFKAYSLKLYNNNTLVRDFVPAKNSSGVVGMYDTVNDVFYENKGSGEFIAGDPVTDNPCRNLADMTEQNIMVGKYVSAEGIISDSENNFTYMTFIPVKPNTTYTLSFSSPLYFASVSEYSTASDGGFITRQTKYSTSITEPFDLTDFTFTTGATTNYIRWGSNMYKSRTITLSDVLSLNYMFEEGDTATAYVPYCEKIKIATTKYNETAFGPLNTALANAISVVDTVVSNTITQAGRIATLQAQKQTRPNDIADDNEKCPAGKKCLLVEDASGVPHWYEIVENASLLPDGYTQLEYIQSTGTQYIDTGVVINSQNYVMKATLATDNGTDNVLFGVAYASNNLQGVTINTAGSFRYGNGPIQALSSPMTSGVVHSLELSWKQLSVDGVVQTTANDTSWPSSVPNYSLYVFGRNGMGTAGFLKAMKLYAFQIYNDGSMIQDLVPAQRNSDGAIGMYDTVSGEFFENKGEGEFIGGQPVFN